MTAPTQDELGRIALLPGGGALALDSALSPTYRLARHHDLRHEEQQ